MPINSVSFWNHSILGLLFIVPYLSYAQANRTYVYQVNKIYQVNAGLGIATQIEIDPAEKIKDYGTGFSSGWDLVRRDNIFYIKPKAADAETNMYVRTDRRSYLFDLKIVTKDWKRIEEAKAAGVTYSVQFTYPDILDVASSAFPSSAKKSSGPIVPSTMPYIAYHMEYDYASDEESKWLAPIKVYDDGELTYIQMPVGSYAPVFFGRTSDHGEEFLINKTVKKNTYVLHGVYPFMVIRHGASTVGIRRRL